MTTPAGAVAARRHNALRSSRAFPATTMITVYLVLLLAIPSNVGFAPMGSLGRPSMLWGLALLVFWVLSRLQATDLAVRAVRQPVRLAMGALVVVALVSYAAAMLRGQPMDQVSPAMTSLLRLLSWTGVLLVTVEGVRTWNDIVLLLRRLTIAGGLLAALGLAQFATGQTLTEFFASIPGLSASAGGIDARGTFVRPSGTASHPLEYGVALSAILPVAIATAVSRGFRGARGGSAALWWLPVVLISASSLVAVSRSALIGVALAIVLMIPALPRGARLPAAVGGGLLAAGVVLAVPGLFWTVFGLFAATGSDPSSVSRTNGLERAPDFIATSPLFGAGFGTFLPRYYIFDNQWVLITVELGLVGAAALAALFLGAIWSALRAGRGAGDERVALAGHALAVSLVCIAVLLAFFDGLSFPIAGGLLFLIAGLCGALRTVGLTSFGHSRAAERVARDDEEDVRSGAVRARGLRPVRARRDVSGGL
ncbi:O-antigen ligase family protein [Microbacterium jiangjiandongii]|uniref:O-antigen ligase family protein n=1 Tax=Microbacterium jiangjiandongii TaxID=3049071 RepID=UPI00214D1371|nr:O-antigen ligase family protein [Microbacterium sp. zg.Y843]MCR2815833.1 O-antigen ligase family protein [Microbacterium sp. zg.Y843]